MQWLFIIHEPTNITGHINIIKDKNHMINSLDSEKTFEKIQQAFIVKVMKSLGIHGSYLKLVKPVYHKPIANINLK